MHYCKYKQIVKKQKQKYCKYTHMAARAEEALAEQEEAETVAAMMQDELDAKKTNDAVANTGISAACEAGRLARLRRKAMAIETADTELAQARKRKWKSVMVHTIAHAYGHHDDEHERKNQKAVSIAKAKEKTAQQKQDAEMVQCLRDEQARMHQL
jgi:hypothetical protein